MISIISGIALMVVSAASFWFLLPKNGEIHWLVRNVDLSSMITIGLLSVFTIGVACLFGVVV